MSNEMKNSAGTKVQSAKEIMDQVFKDLRENRPIRFQDSSDHLSCRLKLHRRYVSLPNISKELILDSEPVEVNLKSSTSLMLKVFNDDRRENQIIAVDNHKSLNAHRGWKSMPALQTNASAVDEQNKKPFVPSAEFKVSTDLLYTAVSSTNSAVITTGSTEVIDIDTSVSLTSTPVEPVIDFSSLQDSVPQPIGDASKSENGLTKFPSHETGSVEMATGGSRGDDALVMDKAAIVAIPRRRSKWRRAIRFAQRIFCCGANSADIDH